MQVSAVVKNILSHYEAESPGVRASLARILMHGQLGGTGKMIVLPVDQGFEHGPARSFAENPAAYDPHYHYQLAVDAGLSAYAAPLGMLSAGADSFVGAIPTILKMNNSNSLSASQDQAVTASIKDALYLGCSGIGFTIYPGATDQFEMFEEIRALAIEAKLSGLAVVIWSYPRGEKISTKGETALDIIAYAAHMAALLGAHIIKVKPPSDRIEQETAKPAYQAIVMSSLKARIAHIMQASFNGKRLVVFSGGASKDKKALLDEVRAIHEGGGNGSIVGRNSFQRPRKEALALLQEIIDIYKE